MKILLTSLLCLTFSAPLFAAEKKKEPSPDDQYKKLTPDSEEQPGVPKGVVTEYEWNDSKVFPGTVRKYSVYVPKQYDGKTPACVFVCQDGMLYRAATVFDNLIHKKEMPVTIGIFIRPGTKPLKPGEVAPKRPDGRPAPASNRSFEYDSLGDLYSRFLLEEILPEVGKQYKLTKDPAERCIAGSSSGGICAWTVCWERPNEFRKCFTTVGSFTNIRGGNKYPELVRSNPRKPIRIFQQDGSNDIVNQFGSWPEANKAMAAALKEKGYDHKFVFGEGVHSGNHGTQLFPEAMRWIWRDWKQ
ncbi:MAG: putative esterase [Limisphaerales bacterium]|nr:MAG: putative esterase [Limisphaerales bacterium]KAG0510442.1 MAG: putative esterase [Limisphaerales bacterium]TXT51629.1 MAG: putative esterase [Limisphaerales bacterium]